jgi:hypothetical protein
MNRSIQLPDKEYPEYVAELKSVTPSIADAIGEFTGIGQVLNWCSIPGWNCGRLTL